MSIIKANAWQSVAGIAYKSVVQVVHFPFSTTYATSTTGTWTPSGTLTLTTKAQSSKILVMAQAQMYSEGTPNGVNIAIRRDVDSTLISHGNKSASNGSDIWQGWGHGTGIATMSARLTAFGLDEINTAAPGTVLTYTLVYGRWSGTGNTWINYAGYSAWSGLTALEILS